MKPLLKAASLLFLPALAGWVLYSQSIQGSGDYFYLIHSWTGMAALLALMLAAMAPELCAVFRWLPRVEIFQRAALYALYVCAVIHAWWFFQSNAQSDSGWPDETLWHAPMGAGVVALLLLLYHMRAQLLRLTAPRWVLLLLTASALFHAKYLGGMLGDAVNWYFIESSDLPRGSYYLPAVLVIWLVLALARRFQIYFVSPVPRFSLLTLVLLISTGFSAFVLHKHWPPWSIESTLAEKPEAQNVWGAGSPGAVVGALSPDGSRGFSSTRDGDPILWNCNSGQSTVLQGLAGNVVEARFSPDGRYLAVVSEALVFIKPRRDSDETRASDTPPELLHIFKDSDAVPEAIRPQVEDVNADGYTGHVVWLYDASTARLMAHIIGPQREYDFSFSRDSNTLLTLSAELGAMVWDCASGRRLAHRPFLFHIEEYSPRCMLPIESVHGWRLLMERHDPNFGEFVVVAPGMPKLWGRMRAPGTPGDRGQCLAADESLLFFYCYPREETRHDYSIEAIKLDGTRAWIRNIELFPFTINSAMNDDTALYCFDGHTLLVQRQRKLECFGPEGRVQVGPAQSTYSRVDHGLRPMLVHTEEGTMAAFNPVTFEVNPIHSRVEGESWPFFAISALSFTADGRMFLECGGNGSVRTWKYRHSSEWWGYAQIPMFWVTLLLAGALIRSLASDYKLRAVSAVPAPVQTAPAGVTVSP